MITTNIELEIGLELTVGCISSPGDELDGSYLIPEREKLMQKHGFLPYFDIGDCGLDIKKNFNHIRSTSSIPVIDYNQRNEKTDTKSLRKRGYDKKGTPFARFKGYYVSPMDMISRKKEYPLFVESNV